MKTAILILKLLTLTAAALVGLYIATTTLNIDGLHFADMSGPDLIQRRCPIHLVPVNWVHAVNPGELELKWLMLEFKARSSLLSALWLIGLGLLIRTHWRSITANHRLACGSIR
jgi:hypothetical protein